MQIIPTSNSNIDSAFGIISGSASSSSDGGFFSAMNDALSSVSDGSSVNVSSALAEDNQPLVESPYSMNSTDGVTYTLDEVCFTKAELAELRQQLVKEGAPEESLRQFDILAGQPDGATLAQVMASLLGKSGAGQFSDEDAHAITALLGQIDPSGTLAEDAIGFMRQGNGAAALELIKDSLVKNGMDSIIELDSDSLQALGRGLGLNADTMRQMLGAIGSGARINGAQFSGLLGAAENQFATEAANAAKLDAALEKTLKPIISKARNRMEKEKEAEGRESRRVQQSKVLIDRTVQQNARATMDSTVAGESEARQGGMIGKAGANAGQDAMARSGMDKNGTDKNIQANIDQMNVTDKTEKTQTGKLVDGNTAGMADNAREAMKAARNGKNFADQEHGSDQKDQSSQEEIWESLLSKIETKPAATSANVNSSSFIYSMLQGNLTNQVLQMEARLDQATLPQLNQQLAQQVEQGMLTAMRDGASRLDLQLHPAELGNIGITLIARNGEVTAQIRSEKSETAEMLQRQMETIRVNLEQQGLKVDKIEVQLEDRSDNNAFEQLGDHNSRQQEQAFRQEMTRLRNLAALRNEPDMAQTLHSTEQQVQYAGNALHVVA